MKKLLFAALAAGIALSASAEIKFVFPKEMKGKKLVMRSAVIKDARNTAKMDTLEVKNNKFTMKEDQRGGAQYNIFFENRSSLSFYTAPGEKVVVEVTSENPLNYTVKGTPLMNAVTELRVAEKALENEYRAFGEKNDREGMLGVQKRYGQLFVDYAKNNPKSEAALYAMLHLDGEEFMNAFNNMDAALKNSILYPSVEAMKAGIERQIAADKKVKELQSGSVMAPNFTLKNLEGKDVSLSDFRGKWVIIDFWGSWCGWGVKGFPKLKEAYEKYKPELEVIGVDCNEPEDKWRKGVEKHQLPWVNVYNPRETNILSEYGVTGFPTKAIINPEGKIANITVGEDPSFFDTLAKLMGK